LFRRQSLTEKELVAFGSIFGPFDLSTQAGLGSPDCPEISYISNLKDTNGEDIGGLGVGILEWHIDQSYLTNPATGALLYAVESPPAEGATSWASLERAYQALPENLRRVVEGKLGVFSYAARLSRFSYTQRLLKDRQDADQLIERIRQQRPDVIHPLTLVHPITGQKALYFDPSTLTRIIGMSDDASATLLHDLTEFATRPEFIYRHEWQIGDLVLWNNGILLHRRDDFAETRPRLLKRAAMFMPHDRHFVPTAIKTPAD
jgi:taurine dioxygenase